MAMNNMKEILITDPNKVLKFYQSQKKDSIIYDSEYANMLSLNKMENAYVFPIEKECRPKTSAYNAQVSIIDPNAATVNQAKENIKNRADSSQVIMQVVSGAKTSKLKRPRGSSESGDTATVKTKAKKPRCKRRKTIVGGDIFAQ